MANTSIGTAWIQIKPTTKGLRQAIETGLNGGQIGSAVGKNFSASFTGAVAGVASTISSKLIGLVSNSMSSAISRVDTLSNFGNVMGNLNIPLEQSQAVIEKLSDKLTGLPTTLDDAAGAVQRFTTSNGDVGKSADMFLALNNALLAGGRSAELQASALEQISQAYAKGKPDMVEWKSLLQVMPAQAAQIGTAFGMSADELGEALRTGELSMDDFMGKIVELNNEGANGFRSFEEQAGAAIDTIETKIAIMRTRLTRLVGAAISGDDLTEPIQKLADQIMAVAPTLIQGFVNALLGVAKVIPQVLPSILETILAMLPELMTGITELIVQIVQMLPTLIPIITAALPTIIDAIITTLLAPETLSVMLQAGYTLLEQLALAIPDIVVMLVEALPQIITNIVSFLTNPDNIAKVISASIAMFSGIVSAVPRIIGALLQAFGTLFAKLFATLKDNFGKFAANFGEYVGGAFKAAINGVLSFIENFINMPIRAINGFIDLINGVFGAVGVNIGRISTISLPRLARGGLVTGVGTATSDSNLYALSKGEYVIRAAAAQDIGYDRLERMNATGEIDRSTEIVNNITINGYERDPNELADIISRKIALRTQGVIG